MAFSPFKRGFGEVQGRIEPSYAQPSDGDFALVLGSDLAGRTEVLLDGDSISVKQVATFAAGTRLLRYWLRVRGPASMPAGTAWRFSALAGAAVALDFIVEPGRDTTYLDCAFNVQEAAAFDVTFKLALESASPDEAEVELPAVYIDAVTEDLTAAEILLINRRPTDGETEVAVGSEFALDIAATIAGTTPDVANTRVYVSINGEPEVEVYNAGFAVGWDGPNSLVSNPVSTDTLRLHFDPVLPFSSLDDVVVRVESETVGGLYTMDESYSFTVQDLTPPVLESAAADGRRTVVVDFDEAVTCADPTDADDALNPANWSLLTTTLPAVQLSVVGVERITDLSFRLSVDIDMTHGATYTVTAANVTDALGNAVVPPDDSATFVALDCRAEGRDFQLIRQLPKINRREDDTTDLRRFISVLQETFDELLCDIDAWSDILDLDLAPERFVDAMLADFAQPFDFAGELSLTDKRRLMRVLVDIYQLKGTEQGIVDVVRFFLGFDVDVIEPYSDDTWVLGERYLGIDTYLGGGTTSLIYSFSIQSPVVLTDVQRERIAAIANYMRPAHTHLIEVFDP
jgi:phage tail-like protein